MLFCGCLQLVSIDVSEDNISYKTVDGVLYNKSGTLLHRYPINKSGQACVIPEGVTNIESGAFHYCAQLTSITLPSTLTSIGVGAFTNCTGITSITIPSNVTNIGSGAFSYCSKLAQITIMDKGVDDIPGAKWGAPATANISWGLE
jgi:hypothetical protein